jgi:hypothetical protein
MTHRHFGVLLIVVVALAAACATVLDGRQAPTFLTRDNAAAVDDSWENQPDRHVSTPTSTRAAPRSGERARVLVVPPKSTVVDRQTLETLAGVIVVEVGQDASLDVVGTSEIERLAELEAERQSSGCDTAACLAELAGALGARYVVFGDVGALGELSVLTLNLFDSKTGTALKRVTMNGRGVEALAQQLPARARELMTPLAAEPAPSTKPAPKASVPFSFSFGGAPAAAPAAPAAQAPCSRQSDCSAGWCRDRGDGRKVCMHDGGAGAYCSNTGDCGSGLWCKDWGGGKRCMGNRAPAGSPCDSGLDCAGRCADRGDGLKVCMGN